MNQLVSDLKEIATFVRAQQKASQDTNRILRVQCEVMVQRINNLSEVLGPIDISDGAPPNSGPSQRLASFCHA